MRKIVLLICVVSLFFSCSDSNSVAEDNLKKGEQFLLENSKKDGVVSLPSGLQYTIVKLGKGKSPSINDKVICHYEGTLINGTIFDSSYAKHTPASFYVDEVILGWKEALLLMKEGARWKLFIPSNLAYGRKGSSGIGSNETLIFTIDLIQIIE